MNAALKLATVATLAVLSLRPIAAHADTRAEWLRIAEKVAGQASARPGEPARTLDQVRDAMGRLVSNGNDAAAARDDFRDAATAVAAFAVLEHAAPGQRDELEMHLALTFSRIPENGAKAAGAIAGRRAAAEVLELAALR